MYNWLMSDLPIPNEVKADESGNNKGKEFDTAAQIGRMALKVVRERTENRYSMPYLDPQRFPREAIEAIRTKSGDAPITDEDVTSARRGAVALAIEAAAQIIEAQAPRGLGVNEELSSLEQVFTLVQRGNGLLIQVEAQDPQAIIQSSREALARRQKVSPDQVKKTDDELKRWAEDNFQRAGQRIRRSVQAVQAYLGR